MREVGIGGDHLLRAQAYLRKQYHLGHGRWTAPSEKEAFVLLRALQELSDLWDLTDYARAAMRSGR